MNLDDRRFLRELGARVRDRRIARRLTQAQLGDASRLHRTFVGSVERGERNVAILSLRRIAAALRVRLGDLVGNTAEGPARRHGPVS
jgi:transcriptional regulator with XRE-family HTH domain